ncbi:MAG: DUF169 domain-containing protein [Syntrophorhabdales bacterium]|jgi:uncharacterized protein (DUF169 family)
MDMEMKKKFERLWKKYFDGGELPLSFFYANERPGQAEMPKPARDHRCLIGDLAKARRGKDIALDGNVIGCAGGRRYLGFSDELMPDFEYFLSYGLPGKLEGERYKKSPELVREVMRRQPAFAAPGALIVFKRWDRLEESDYPDVVIFFARPDALSGLFTLANFDEVEPNAVLAPFGAGCSTIVQYPYMEKDSERPRAILGMLDVSARPCVPADTVTMAIPMRKFVRMVENMEESFLATGSWRKVKRRIIAIPPAPSRPPRGAGAGE